jgi:hypothetical protein
MIEVTGIIPPTIFTSSIDGKRYIVPDWIEVDKDFDISKNLVWKRPVFEKEKELARVKASRGNTVYIISEYKGKIKCSCSGFRYKKVCKHITEYK